MKSLLDQLLEQTAAVREQVRKNNDLEASIIEAWQAQSATLQKLQQKLDEAAATNDQTKLKALSDALGGLSAETAAQGQKWADAIAANTQADPNQPKDDDGGPRSNGDGATGSDTVTGTDEDPKPGQDTAQGDDTAAGGLSGQDTAAAAGNASADPNATPVGQAGPAAGAPAPSPAAAATSPGGANPPVPPPNTPGGPQS